MKWVFLLLVVANIAFALTSQLNTSGESSYSRPELSPKKIELVPPRETNAAQN